MESWAVLLPIGLMVVPACLYLRRFFADHPGVREWVTAWVVLYLTGIYDASFAPGSTMAAGGELLSNLFVAWLALGAFRFMEHTAPRGLLAWLIGAGVVTTVWQAFQPAIGDAVGSAVRAGVIGWVALQLHQHARATQAGLGATLTAPALLGLAVVQGVDTDLWLVDSARSQLHMAWLVFAAASAGMQMMAFVDRFQTRADELQEERELSRRIPDTVGRGGDLRWALERLAREVRTPTLPGAAVFAHDPEAGVFELVEWPEGTRAPRRPLVRIAADAPWLQAVLETRGPVVLDATLTPSPAEPPGAARARRVGAVACALRAEGEIVGLLSLEPGQPRAAERLLRRLGWLVPIADLALSRTRNEAERHLHANELGVTQRLFEATLAALPVGIVIVGPDGILTSANHAASRLLDLDPLEAWVGRHVNEVIGVLRPRLRPEVTERFDTDVRSWMAEPGFVGDPVELRFDDDRTLRVTGKRGPDRPTGRVFVIEDVTADRQMGERLQHAQRMETVGTLAGGLAHDFNNLLTAILGNAQLLLHDSQQGDPHRETLEEMARAAEHCAELTRGLLTFAQQSPVSRRLVEVAPLLEEVERLLRPSLAPDTGLRMEVSPGTPPILADPGELRRVITSLLVNAREAVGRRGSIECAVGAASEAGFVEIVVRDDGIGMAEATRRRAFDPFFTTKAKGRGTGLGLAVAYGIAEAHGATIEVESQLGVGSMFRVLWPSADLQEEAPAVRRPGDESATVLVAEDEDGVRRMVRRALQRAGYRVMETHDGERAVAEFARHRDEIALVVCDLSMPGRDGLSAIADMRVLRPGLPALLMSGHPGRDIEMARPLDVGLLAKPFGPDRLVERVEQTLAEAKRSEPSLG